MTVLNLANFASTVLVSDMTYYDDFCDVEDASAFPDPPFRVRIDEEIIEVGAIDRTINRLSNLTRGVEGTVPAFHQLGAAVENVWTAGTYEGLVEAIESITPQKIGAETPSGAQEKADAAEENAKEFARQVAAEESNARFRTLDASLADWNELTNLGASNYLVPGNAKNGPGPSIYFIPFVLKYADSKDVTQLAIPIGNQTAVDQGVYIRSRIGGNWTSWRKFLHSGNHPVITVSKSQPLNPKEGDIWIRPS